MAGAAEEWERVMTKGGTVPSGYETPPGMETQKTAVPVRRPVGPRVPDEFRGMMGGMYYPPDHVERLAAALKKGDITKEQYDKALKEFGQWLHTGPGLVSRHSENEKRYLSQANMARQAGYEIEARAHEARAGEYARLSSREQGMFGQWRKRRQNLLAYRQQKRDQWQRAVEKLERMQVDPDKFWEKRGGVGGRFIAGIAAAFGAVGAMAWGTENFAQNAIQRAMDQEIQSQKANIEIAGAGVKARQSIIGMINDEVQDLDASEQLARSYLYNNVANKIEAIAAASGSGVTRAKGAEEATKVRALRDQADINAEMRILQMYMLRQQQAAAAHAAQQKQMAKLRKLGQGRFLDEKEGGRVVRAVVKDPKTGLWDMANYGMLVDPGKQENIDKLRATSAELLSMNQNWESAKQLLQKLRLGGLAAPVQRKLQDALAQYYGKEQVAMVFRVTGKQSSEVERQRIIATMGKDPREVTSHMFVNVGESMERYQEVANRDYINRMKSLGARGIVRRAPVLDPEDERFGTMRYHYSEQMGIPVPGEGPPMLETPPMVR
jgi:hypothetical protein